MLTRVLRAPAWTRHWSLRRSLRHLVLEAACGLRSRRQRPLLLELQPQELGLVLWSWLWMAGLTAMAPAACSAGTDHGGTHTRGLSRTPAMQQQALRPSRLNGALHLLRLLPVVVVVQGLLLGPTRTSRQRSPPPLQLQPLPMQAQMAALAPALARPALPTAPALARGEWAWAPHPSE